MSSDPTAVTIERHDGKPLALVLRGDVNIYSAGLLHELAETVLHESEDVVAACEGLDHLDASALQVLLALAHGLQAQGRSLRLAGARAELESLLQLAGVNGAFPSEAAAQSN